METNLSLAEANRQHWDKMASQYESKEWQKTMIAYITSQLQARRDIFGIPLDNDKATNFRLLDYACGTGVVSRSLGPYVTQILGIDLSANMVSTYNENAAKAGIPTEVTHAVQGNLLDEVPYLVKEDGEKTTDQQWLKEAQFNNFDAVIIGLGFHHFENYARCLEILSRRLKPGGRVGIVDLFPKEGHLESLAKDYKGIMHVNGFTEEQMRGYMQEVGLVDVMFWELPEKVYMEIQGVKTDRRLFFASGRRA